MAIPQEVFQHLMKTLQGKPPGVRTETLLPLVDKFLSKVEVDDGDEVWNEYSGKLESIMKIFELVYQMGVIDGATIRNF